MMSPDPGRDFVQSSRPLTRFTSHLPVVSALIAGCPDYNLGRHSIHSNRSSDGAGKTPEPYIFKGAQPADQGHGGTRPSILPPTI